ncbi:hypothetical protein [Enhygromyxa salina]|uniref:Cytochrome C Planctomycete-type domain-containing protein n=1 Tax=Enhygromyxa salina TaxID=215803 RepID=A0A2S9Y1Q5_9BACT|nr:hypothetical protein [Enhygromyxa salina]PRP99042.1 hypothetical protein ENSA7_64260 [Enhygromyxa salina]
MLATTLAASGCKGDDDDDSADNEISAGDGDGDLDAGTDTETGTDTGDNDLELATLTHRFGTLELSPYQETEPCVQWTLDNEAPLYVQAVTLSNLGYFHHSNWFVVPNELYAGEDGYFKCSDRGFNELGAATAGSVLYAQSTQSFVEEQRTGAGAVIKIPPHHKVIADIHMLNVGPDTVTTDLFMTLEVIHPKDVEVVLAAIRASYIDLDIPAGEISKFTGVCDDFGKRYADATGKPIDMKLHYVLPHYHYLGNHFNLSFMGGPLHDQDVFTVDGFDASAIGGVFDPPLDLTDVEGIRYTCGYDNWRDVNVGWGIGDQEMCVMLALAETKVIMDMSVTGGTASVGVDENGVIEYEGPCGVLAVPKNPALGLPTDAERDGPLLVPDSGDEGIPPVPECTDHDPAVAPVLAPTLENVFAAVFQPSCMFNACHGASGQVAGLNLQAPDLLAELLEHEVLGNPGAALVEPGDPENSWLYQVMASCEPMADGGEVLAHMPRNAPTLLNDQTVALVREWIAAGALP